MISFISDKFTKTFSPKSSISYKIKKSIFFILNIFFFNVILFIHNSVDLNVVSSIIVHFIESILRLIFIKSVIFFLLLFKSSCLLFVELTKEVKIFLLFFVFLLPMEEDEDNLRILFVKSILFFSLLFVL